MATVKVSARDIKLGGVSNSLSCPIARAAKRAFRKPISVGYKSLFILSGSGLEYERHEYPLPKKAQAFITKFDDGKTVRPFTFTMKRDNTYRR
jgi:hypothetical protein